MAMMHVLWTATNRPVWLAPARSPMQGHLPSLDITKRASGLRCASGADLKVCLPEHFRYLLVLLSLVRCRSARNLNVFQFCSFSLPFRLGDDW